MLAKIKRFFRPKLNNSSTRILVIEDNEVDQKIACKVQVHLLHHVNVLDILVRYHRDGDGIYIHLVLLYEMKEQIQRAFEYFKFDVICHKYHGLLAGC